MGNARLEPLDTVSFVCSECSHSFKAKPGRVESAPERAHHPHSYFSDCPECGEESQQVFWEQNLLGAYPKATGPKTEEGRAASAANLKGHPTPEETHLTRFNAMKHGLFARTATFFPAKPGHYPQCAGCEHLEEETCVPQRACLKRTELFLKHQVAFEAADPSMLMSMRSDTQAMIQGLIDDMLITIAMDGGPRLKSPEWYSDKDGGFHLAAYTDDNTKEKIQLYKLEDHPLLKHLITYLSKNAMTLADLEMTPKSKDDTDILKGYLGKKDNEQQSVLEHQQNQTLALDNLRDQIARSQNQIKHDPVLIEHGEMQDG